MTQTIDKKIHRNDFDKLQEAGQMVREASGLRRREILNEVYVPLLREYNKKYGVYNPLQRP